MAAKGALESVLAEIHSHYSAYLLDRIKKAQDPDSEVTVDAAFLNNLRQFLKDNHIEAEADTQGDDADAFNNLVKETTGGNVLPFSPSKFAGSGD